MPNYLQRIVMSGARTTSPAKPPAFSRTLMPPIGSSVRTFAGEEEPRLPEVDASVDSALPAKRMADDMPLEAAMPTGVIQGQSIAAPEINVYHAPRIEQVHDPVVRKPSVVESTVPLQPAPAVSSVTVFAPRDLRRGNAKSDRGQQITKVVEETLRTFSSHLLEVHLESKAAVQVPGEVVVAPAQGETIRVLEESRNQLEPKQAVVNLAPLPAKAPSPNIPSPITGLKVQEGEVENAAEAGPSSILRPAKIQGTETKPSVVPVKDSQSSQPIVKPLPERPLVDAGRLEDRISAPKQPAQRGIFNATDKRRRNQISIGRIDVQVNNLPQRESPAPAPAKQPMYSSFLETSYLDRFFLKL